MARQIPHENAEDWTYPIDPETVLHNTLTGTGYTVNLQTGKTPTTGTMVSIPGHEKTVPTSKITPSDISEFATSEEHRGVLNKRNSNLGTWNTGEDVFLDVSRRYPNTVGGARAARSAAMRGDQFAIYNIDRGLTEQNVAVPKVRQQYLQKRNIEISEDAGKEYLESTSPVGLHVTTGFRTAPDKRTRGRRRAGAGQGTIVWTGEPNQF